MALPSEPGELDPGPMWKLAVPLAAQQVGFQLMGTVDSALLGHHSQTALAASGVGNNLLFAITSIGLGIVMGLDTVIPQAIGGGRMVDARRYLSSGLALAVLVGIACSIAVLAAPAILALADVAPDVTDAARTYIYLRAIGIVPFLVSIALRSYLAARNVTRPLIIAVIAGNVANAALDLVLIFGVPSLGIPALGIVGAALATLAVQLVITGVYFAAVRTLDTGPRPAATRADVVEIARYGGPVGGQLLAEVGIFGVATVLAAHLGTRSAAAHSIALNLASFTFAVAVGIGSATSVRVGHAIGAGDRALARRRGLEGVAIGLGCMGISAIVFLAVPAIIAAWFTDEPAVVAATVPLLQIAALFQLSDGTQAIGAGALRGLGDTRATLVGNLIGHYGVGLGISIVLAFPCGLGVAGLWWGLSGGLTATAAYLVLRFVVVTRTASR
ncbi:MAG TPA: MATE family efflux transporter [Kofleriaceae bacterium]|nr:MATE family efflux transporter [Kofleriaceae bacterium]